MLKNYKIKIKILLRNYYNNYVMSIKREPRKVEKRILAFVLKPLGLSA